MCSSTWTITTCPRPTSPAWARCSTKGGLPRRGGSDERQRESNCTFGWQPHHREAHDGGTHLPPGGPRPACPGCVDGGGLPHLARPGVRWRRRLFAHLGLPADPVLYAEARKPQAPEAP